MQVSSKRLIQGLALLGLGFIVIFPAPYLVGVLVSGTCLLVILGTLVSDGLDALQARIAAMRKARAQKFHRRSGVAKKEAGVPVKAA